MAELKKRIEQDLVAAMKSGQDLARDTLRMLAAAIKNKEIEKREELTNDDLVALLRKEAKTRDEAAVQYEQAGSQDRAMKERQEKKIIEGYLPTQMSDEELTRIVAAAVKTAGATSIQDMGKVMKEVMPKVSGQADGGKVSEIVKKQLT